MTNRLESIHRTIPHIQPLQVICSPTISKIMKTQKKKENQTYVACRLSLAKEYNIFCHHDPYTVRRKNSKTEKM